MISEWLKVMLEEISRKNMEAEQALIEEQRRSVESLDLKVAAPRSVRAIPEE